MKKALSLALAVLMVLGMTTVAFAAVTPWNPTTKEPKADTLTLELPTIEEKYAPNAKIKIYIKTNAGADYIDKSVVSGLKLTAQVKVAGSQTYIKSTNPTIKYDSTTKAAYFEIQFVDPFVSTSTKDLEITAYLRANKSKIDKTEETFSTSFGNTTQYVDEDDDFVFVVDDRVVEAEDYIKAIDVELDYGITIKTRMLEGKKYYGYADMDPTSGDEEIMDQYPTIEIVYNLKTINLNGAGDIVTFDDDALYAYGLDADGALVYLGKTNKALPYQTKYFLSTTQLDLPVATEEPAEEEVPAPELPVETDNAATGGDDVVVANQNDNPGTGC